MKRVLLGQMTHEWKNNIWLILELALVALAVWTMLFLLWTTCRGLFQPRGFTPQDVYSIGFRSIPESSPYFVKEYKDNYFEDRDELMRRLRENPNIESVSLQNNFLPYSFSWIGNNIRIEGEDSILYQGNFRKAEPSIIKLLDIRSTTGRSQDELEAMLERGEILLSEKEDFEEENGAVKNLIGKTAFLYNDPNKPVKIGDIVQAVRRSDFEETRGQVIIPLLDTREEYDLLVKVKPNHGKDFEEEFNKDLNLSHLRNVYLTDLMSLVKRGESVHKETQIKIRLMVGISCFFLITIFLGLLGSFWFRVQQRVSEIAIRKTFGASNRDIFQRIIGEGLLLLLGGLILTSACVWPFIRKIADGLGEHWYTLLAIEGLTAGLMALGIVLSLWYPAWRAMKIEPAIAVKEE